MNREDYGGGMWDVDRHLTVRPHHTTLTAAHSRDDGRLRGEWREDAWDIGSRTLPREEFTPHPTAPTGDKVTMPSHYARHPVEPIRFAVENYGPGFLIGNIVKYVTRYDAKDGHKDLAKAARYIEMLRRYEMGDPDWYKAEHTVEPLPAAASHPLRTLGNKAPANG